MNTCERCWYFKLIWFMTKEEPIPKQCNTCQYYCGIDKACFNRDSLLFNKTVTQSYKCHDYQQSELERTRNLSCYQGCTCKRSILYKCDTAPEQKACNCFTTHNDIAEGIENGNSNRMLMMLPL